MLRTCPKHLVYVPRSPHKLFGIYIESGLFNNAPLEFDEIAAPEEIL